MILDGLANPIEPRSELMSQQGSSLNSFSDFAGLQRTKTWTFSEIDVDFDVDFVDWRKIEVDDDGVGYADWPHPGV